MSDPTPPTATSLSPRPTRPSPPSNTVSSPDLASSGAVSFSSPDYQASNGNTHSPSAPAHPPSFTSLHHALRDIDRGGYSASASATPVPAARATARSPLKHSSRGDEASRTHSRASSVDRASSASRSRPGSPSPHMRSPPSLSTAASSTMPMPVRDAHPGAPAPVLSTNPSNSQSHTRQSTIFDPLPPLPSRLRQASLKLVPPPNFGYVEDSLYRSGEPADLSFPFLERLGLKTLVWLAPHAPGVRLREFLRQHHIDFHDLGIKHAASIDAVTDDAVTHALQVALSPASYPLIIMCGGGSHRTGTVVGCLRKLQRWNLASIFEEYRRYAGALHHIMNEQFIEFYDTRSLALPVLNMATLPDPNLATTGSEGATSTVAGHASTLS